MNTTDTIAMKLEAKRSRQLVENLARRLASHLEKALTARGVEFHTIADATAFFGRMSDHRLSFHWSHPGEVNQSDKIIDGQLALSAENWADVVARQSKRVAFVPLSPPSAVCAACLFNTGRVAVRVVKVWTPRDSDVVVRFDAAFEALPDEAAEMERFSYEQRVLDEKLELDIKIEKLKAFISTAAFEALDWQNKYFLHQQLLVMQQYSQILERRLDLFSTQEKT